MTKPVALIRKAYRYRLRTLPAATERTLRRWDGCCRKVWNLAIDRQQQIRESGGKYTGFAGMCRWLTEWRGSEELAYLREVPVHVLQNVVRSLDRAYQRFFKKEGGYPRFKRYGEAVGLRETDVACFSVDAPNGRIKFPKIGWLRYRASRPVDGIPKTTCLRREADGWYVAIQVEIGLEATPVPVATAIGAADRGITNFLATDVGRLVEPLDAHKRSLYRLRRYQRAVARKMEAAKVAAGIPKDKPFPRGFRLTPSNRLRRAQDRVAKIHCKIARQRTDFLHKLSSELANTHAVFCIEDLKVRNMSASAAGDADSPGRNVRQKTGLNRSILDQGWSAWASMLEYKLDWRGGQLVKVPPAYTSQACAVCGHVHSGNRKGELFRCLACGHTDHADVNAAKNILAAGLAVLAGEPSQAGVEDAGQSARPVKRQPTKECADAT